MYKALAVAGGTYKHADLSLSAQRTINFWPQRQEAGNEKSPYTLESFYGLASFSAGTGLNRGIFEHLGVLYKLTGTTLTSVSSTGVRTTLGTIPGDDRAIFDGFGTGIVITADGVAYYWNGVTLTTGSDTDFETPDSVTVINSQALYDGDNGRFCSSDVGAPLTINALNYATAEYQADSLVRVYAFLTVVYMMGSKSIEQWWNNPQVEQPPFSRIEGGSVNRGLGALHSVANDGQVIYFFGSDDQVYSLLGASATPLLPKVIVREIQSFTTKDDAIGWCMSIDGQWFYVLKFPSADRTFVYPKGGEWFELSSGVMGGRYNGDGYAYCFGKHLIADEDGDILELDLGTFTENGSTIRRVRTLSPIHGGLFGAPGKEIEISSFRLVGKTGTGELSGQGSDPVVMLQYSYDGENFGTEIWGRVGKMGVLTEILFDIGEAHDNWIFRIVSTDPVYSSWHAAGIEMEICP
jgi:hypothetical protein